MKKFRSIVAADLIDVSVETEVCHIASRSPRNSATTGLLVPSGIEHQYIVAGRRGMFDGGYCNVKMEKVFWNFSKTDEKF